MGKAAPKSKWDSQVPNQRVFYLMGLCLLSIQRAEEQLSGAVEQVLERSTFSLDGQSRTKQRQTLGDFLNRLKRQGRIEYGLKERLFKFLDMRNKFIHNFGEIPGWDLQTAEGREVAELFMLELTLTAFAISGLFIALYAVSAKDEFGRDLFEDDPTGQQIVSILEKNFGTRARAILAGRYAEGLRREAGYIQGRQ